MIFKQCGSFRTPIKVPLLNPFYFFRRRRREFCDHVEGYGSVCDCDNPAPLDELSSNSSPVLNNQVRIDHIFAFVLLLMILSRLLNAFCTRECIIVVRILYHSKQQCERSELIFTSKIKLKIGRFFASKIESCSRIVFHI